MAEQNAQIDIMQKAKEVAIKLYFYTRDELAEYPTIAVDMGYTMFTMWLLQTTLGDKGRIGREIIKETILAMLEILTEGE